MFSPAQWLNPLEIRVPIPSLGQFFPFRIFKQQSRVLRLPQIQRAVRRKEQGVPRPDGPVFPSPCTLLPLFI